MAKDTEQLSPTGLAKPSVETRYWTIDALRGIAALAVALFHVNKVATGPTDGTSAQLIHQALQFGYLGVSIFFVISGFVIAASLSNSRVTFGYFGKFTLKRSIRLDPTYWASIALDILLTFIALQLLLADTPLPDVKKVVLHLFYLQDIAGVGNIASIYWTLCLEIQFYIVFCGVLALHTHFAAKFGACKPPLNLKAWLFALITGYSMLVSAQLLQTPIQGLFVTHWILFAMGAAAFHWGMRNRADNRGFPLVLTAMLAVVLYQAHRVGAVYSLMLGIAWTTALGLYIGARANRLDRWMRNDVLLYFGSRSYSIYLFHTIIGERAADLMAQVVFPKLGLAMPGSNWSIAAFLIGLGASLAAAEVAYRLVEYPSLLLSKRIRPSKPGSPIKDLMRQPYGTAPRTYAPSPRDRSL